MQLGLVIGTAIATARHASFKGQKLLVVQPLMADGRTPDADPVIAADVVGAGRGEVVMITSDGKYIRELTKDESTPLRWSIIGIQDS
ncbi:EutN/CcmL family microcompartment protein [Anatilimnocola sp. NA78]|uniref:EutN/CcmL family microcompartment protein n=1 Tax=Anatilimnocola sp. NA78 TaxID=3415683 RepID=UPI003CE50E22